MLRLLCLGCFFCRLDVSGSSLLWSLLLVGFLGLVACQGFLVEGTCVCVEMDIFFLECNDVSSSEFWVVYGISMALGRLSFYVLGCVHVFLED